MPRVITAIQAAIVGVLILVIVAATAIAQEPCFDLDYVKDRAAQTWPNAVMTVYEGEAVARIERGLASIGAKMPDADRTFMVIDLGGNAVRVVGFNGGCYEDHLDVGRAEISAWLDGVEG